MKSFEECSSRTFPEQVGRKVLVQKLDCNILIKQVSICNRKSLISNCSRKKKENKITTKTLKLLISQFELIFNTILIDYNFIECVKK